MLLLLLVERKTGDMKNTIIFILVAIAGFLNPAKAQYFTDIEADLTHVMYAGGTWIDKDDDGDLDLIVSGGYLTGNNPLESSKFYTNVNRERYFRYLKTSVTNITRGAIDAGDYDNDGDLDLILTGRTRQGKPVTQLYRNERNNIFRKVSISIPNLYNGDVKIADFNRDGNQDIAICGKDANEEAHTLVYAGDGKGGFEPVRIPALGVHNGELAWGDYDNDGDLDLFLAGLSHDFKPRSKIYRNERIQLEKDSVSVNHEYDIPDAMSIWDMYEIPKERRQPYYYFMTSSCFCRLTPPIPSRIIMFLSARLSR